MSHPFGTVGSFDVSSIQRWNLLVISKKKVKFNSQQIYHFRLQEVRGRRLDPLTPKEGPYV